MKNIQLAAAILFLIIVFSVNSFGIYAQDVDKNDLIDGLIARGSLIKTGVLLYETETYNIDDYGDGPPWQWSEDDPPRTCELTIAEDEHVLRWPGHPNVSMLRDEFSTTYYETPQPDGDIDRSLVISDSGGVIKPIEEDIVSYFLLRVVKAGALPWAEMETYVDEKRESIELVGSETIRGIETQMLRMILPLELQTEVMPGGLHPSYNGHDFMVITFYVAPELAYSAVRIEYATPNGYMTDRYEAVEFMEVAEGVFFPKCYGHVSNFTGSGRGYYCQQYKMLEVSGVNEPVPESAFEVDLPEGSRVRDSRTGQDNRVFYTDSPISFTTADELVRKAEP